MNEFSNRMNLQRKVLSIINSDSNITHELFGLSENAISRWCSDNNIKSNSDILTMLREVAKKLFFLATKSQEQVSNEYENLSSDVNKLISELKKKIG